MKYDAIVIGGGVVGTSIAYHLARAAVSTLLVDRVDRGRATDAAAGIVSAETYGGDSQAWSRFACAAAGYYPPLLAELEAAGQPLPSYHRCGMLIVAHADDEVVSFDAMLAAIRSRQARAEIAGEDELRPIDMAEARRRLPELADARRVLYSARAARVDGRLLNLALLRAARAAGLSCRVGSVERLVLAQRRVTAAIVDGEQLQAELFVIAGGAWSEALAQQLGVSLPLRPQRGQLVHLAASKLDTGSWPMVEGFRGHYLVPWPDGRVVAGATRESDAGFGTEPTVAGVTEVMDEAVRMVKALDKAALAEVRVGLRPLSADGLPIIGPLAGCANTWVATGHGPYGLHLGPYSGKRVAELLTSPRQNGDDLADFSPSRF